MRRCSEEDLGLANMALDLLGQSRALYAYAADIEDAGRSEDDLAFLRLERQYQNCLLVERPNGDFAHTILRQLYFAAFMHPFLAMDFCQFGRRDPARHRRQG